MNTHTNLTKFMLEKAKSVFDLDETLTLLQASFPLRTSCEEFQKLVAAKAVERGISTEDVIDTTLKPVIGAQNIRNWFSGKVVISRESAIKIAFALQLNLDEAEHFTMHSCGHDGFYLRNYKDLIYVFYLGRECSYEDASSMINEFSELNCQNPDVEVLHSVTSHFRITEWLQNEFFHKVETEADLREFLRRNKSLFGSFRRKTYEIFVELYATLKEDTSYSDSQLTDDDICEMVLLHIPSLRGRHDISHEILRKIAEKTLPRSGLSEIINKTPDRKTVVIPQVDRKHLILAWLVAEGGALPYFDESSNPEDEFEECVRVLNFAILEACGFPRLDARNPFDWLIINALYYCYFESADDDAVDRIQTVIDALYGGGMVQSYDGRENDKFI
ncbi:MAG: hypothetical protein FWC13_11035 [Oscillospiraceae bacterium]|nr:hypothetical protein [Oscillospiraceae bacterium]